MSKRKPGFYWIKIKGHRKWHVANYDPAWISGYPWGTFYHGYSEDEIGRVGPEIKFPRARRSKHGN